MSSIFLYLKDNWILYNLICIVFANIDFRLVNIRVEINDKIVAIVLSIVYPFSILAITFDLQIQSK